MDMMKASRKTSLTNKLFSSQNIEMVKMFYMTTNLYVDINDLIEKWWMGKLTLVYTKSQTDRYAR